VKIARSLGLGLTLAAATALAAATDYTLKARRLTAPVFDAAGQLTRRLTAASAVGSLTESRLENGQVEFFAPASADQVVATLEFDAAHYVNAAERIDGDGTIAFTAPDGTVRGRGFTCELETGRLTLAADVTFTAPAARMTADRGELNFDPKAPGGDRAIKAATLADHVVLERAPTAKAPFERAETAFARYRADEGKIFLQTPVTVWNHGKKALMQSPAGFIAIELAEKPAALAK
jgi:hypothetical protein